MGPTQCITMALPDNIYLHKLDHVENFLCAQVD